MRMASAFVFPKLGGFLGGTGYDAATTGRRLHGWTATNADINTLVFGSLEALRSRSRDQVRRNSWAKNAVDSFTGNCVGTGIKPQSQHPDPELRKQIQRLWTRWTDEADADSLVDFYGLQALVCREIMEAGECLVRLRPRFPQDGLSVPLQIQGLEPEQLPAWYTSIAPNGNIIRAGIEFNVIGRRVAYHLLKTHPGDATNPLLSTEIVPVPADYIRHLFNPIRFGQLRGQPWLAQVLVKLFELDMYDDAELVRKKVAAMFAGFIKQNAPEDQLLGEKSDDDGDALLAGLEPGTMQKLLPGEEMQFSAPPDVGTQYETFMRVQLRSIAAGMGITYEQLTGDLTGVNYSSIRAGLLEFRRRCEQFQHQQIVFQFCRPVWAAWIQAALLSGALKADPNDSGLYDVKWVPPGWAWVDPLKDVRANVMEVRAGFKSRSDVVSEQGEDIEVVDAEIASDNKRTDELGLKYDSDGRDALASGSENAIGGGGK